MMAPAGVKESEDLVPSKHGSFSRGFDPNITTYLISRSLNLKCFAAYIQPWTFAYISKYGY